MVRGMLSISAIHAPFRCPNWKHPSLHAGFWGRQTTYTLKWLAYGLCVLARAVTSAWVTARDALHLSRLVHDWVFSRNKSRVECELINASRPLWTRCRGQRRVRRRLLFSTKGAKLTQMDQVSLLSFMTWGNIIHRLDTFRRQVDFYYHEYTPLSKAPIVMKEELSYLIIVQYFWLKFEKIWNVAEKKI